jgi:hypothetical protein
VDFYGADKPSICWNAEPAIAGLKLNLRIAQPHEPKREVEAQAGRVEDENEDEGT